MKLFKSLLLVGAVAFVYGEASAQTTATTTPVGFLNVQGVLHDNGVPVNGFMWFCFDVYAAPTGGTSLAHDTNMNYVLVSNGVANVTYRIGDVGALGLSPTQELYLQMDVSRTGEPGSFTPLEPRQRIVPSLFATLAVRAEEARRLIEPISPDLLPSSLPGLSFTSAPSFAAISGAPFTVASSAVVAGLDADLLDGLDSTAFWKLAGNAGTTAGVDFLGTTDNQALELKVYNQRALRLEPTATSPNVIAGSGNNVINATAGSSILGGNLHRIDGSAYSVIGGGYTNQIQVSAAESTIGGGAVNLIGSGSEWATIAGGFSNTVTKSATTIGGGVMNSIVSGHGTIAGGNQNTIYEFADYSTVGGGNFNIVNPNSTGATIGGGITNKVDQAALYGTVSGGYSNVVGRPAGTIAGGQYNLIAAQAATIGGGVANQVQYEAKGSVIGGGAGNAVQSFATNGVIAGGFANVIHTNANYSSIGGGSGNHIGSATPFATIPGGREGRALSYGQVAHASGGFGGQEGTAQESFYVVRGTTTDTNTTELFLDGAAERVHVPSGSTWTFDVLVSARGNTAASAGFHIRGTMSYNNAGNLIVIGTPVADQFGGGASVSAQVLADNVNKALVVSVRWGLVNASSVRWVATVRTAEVMF